MKYAPILLFVYDRPTHLRRLISSLVVNELANESELFIYSDAAKDETNAPAVKAVREYVRTIKGFASVTIIEREKNVGLAANIIEGVTTTINKYGRVIVLEDDLIVAPFFLKFMNQALEIYKDEPEIGHIHACEFFEDYELPDTFLVKFTGSWGWATWDRAWKHFNPNGKELLEKLKKEKLDVTFNFNGAYNFTRMLYRQTIGKNNSWAIRWNASLFLQNILSLNVGKSLVQNKGFDGSGTNCGGGDLYNTNLFMGELPVKKIEPMVENKQARKSMEKYYRKTNSFTAKAIRRIKRTLKGDFGA